MRDIIRKTLAQLRRLPALLLAAGLIAAPLAYAQSLPKINASVLQYGTVHWELAAMVEEGLDRSNGFELVIDTRANLSASHLALASGQADVIVGDWIWAIQRHDSGAPKLFMPYSAAIGSLIVKADSDIQSITDLADRRIGVAGGPNDKGWILLQAAAQRQGVELGLPQVQFAAPPLLNQALKRDQIDAVLTYWHFGARLLAEGQFRELQPMAELAERLGLSARMPMLGYVFERAWADAHPELVSGFAAAVAATKALLMESETAWESIRPLMRAEDDALFAAYVSGYRAGHPGPLTVEPSQIESAQSLYQMIREQSPDASIGPEALPADMFYQAAQ